MYSPLEFNFLKFGTNATISLSSLKIKCCGIQPEFSLVHLESSSNLKKLYLQEG